MDDPSMKLPFMHKPEEEGEGANRVTELWDEEVKKRREKKKPEPLEDDQRRGDET
jgi:hypothetical protein